MFVSGCSPLSPAMTTYWMTPGGSPATGSGSDPLNLSPTASAALYRQELLALSDTLRLAKANGLRANGAPGTTPPGAASAALQSLQNSSLFFTEILYPSVIPLPGTLPQTPGHAGSSPGSKYGDKASSATSRDRDNSSPDSIVSRSRPNSPTGADRRPPALGPPPPAVTRSAELKFGIDRILKSGENHDPEELNKDKPLMQSPAAGSLPPVLAPCPCTAPSCSLVFSPLSYHGPHHHHPGHSLSTHHPHTLSTYGGHRPSEFPGPFALLTSSDQSPPNHSSHPGSQQPKRKRSWSRAVFSNLQRKGLEKRFEVQKYVTKPDRRQLAAMLGLTDAQVKVWFQNRRMKWRHQEEAKKKKEEDSQKSGVDRGSDDVNSMSPDMDVMPEDNGEMIVDDDDDDDDDRDIDVDDDVADDDVSLHDGGKAPTSFLASKSEAEASGERANGVVDTLRRQPDGERAENPDRITKQKTSNGDVH